MYDTLIIGAGMSGLAAGVRLAYYDQRVCILERHTAIGGLNSYYRRGGRNFDVGLHAVTNFSPKGARQGPLARLLRQLRLTWDEFALAPQLGSTIAFPGISLRFSNDFELLRSEIRSHFPRQMDRFDRLVGEIADYDQFGEQCNRRSARAVVGALVDEPLLVEMIFCPVLFYGGCREQDLEFGQFSVLFRSIFLEGLARPLAGVRLILDKLVRKFKEMGGELRLRTGVSRILVKNQTVDRVVLDNGSELSARRILSSAGWPETMRLCDDSTGPAERVGKLSFVESISTLDCPPRPRLGPHDGLLQRFRRVLLRASGRSCGPAQRRGLLAEQLRLQRTDGRQHGPDHGAGELRPLGGTRPAIVPPGQAPLVR